MNDPTILEETILLKCIMQWGALHSHTRSGLNGTTIQQFQLVKFYNIFDSNLFAIHRICHVWWNVAGLKRMIWGCWIKFFVGITCAIAPSPALCACEFMVKGLVQ